LITYLGGSDVREERADGVALRIMQVVELTTDNVKRAWETCVLKAHGYEPVWQKTSLAPASRAALKAIDLHFHDLRHEGASRLLEAGWPLHHVQEMLGHASLEQTSTSERPAWRAA
jgi:integrase